MDLHNKINLSALIVARNEEKNIQECLHSLSYADEIVLILDRTSDKTYQIAKKFNCKIYQGSWQSEGNRRNYGISKCTNNWIIEIDADERASKTLLEEAKSKISSYPENSEGYFLVPFDNFIGEKKVRYGWGASWGVSAKACLFHKNAKSWSNQIIHPQISLGKQLGHLSNRIHHFVDTNISDMILRLDRYTTAKASEIRNSNKKIPPLWITIRRSLTRFYKCYITRKGYKERGWGFLNATFAALFVLISYIKADLENEDNVPKKF